MRQKLHAIMVAVRPGPARSRACDECVSSGCRPACVLLRTSSTVGVRAGEVSYTAGRLEGHVSSSLELAAAN